MAQFPEQPTRILDIGCGTGTLAIELARNGHDVHAIDPAPGMIEFAALKAHADKVTWTIGTAASVSFDHRFDAAIMTGHAFQCLLTDQLILEHFQAVQRHLKVGGIFLFESRDPAARAWERWRPEFAEQPVALENGEMLQVVHEVVSAQHELVTFKETYMFSGGGPVKVSESTLRFASCETILDLARSVGLRSKSIFGDWDGGAVIGGTTKELIFRLVNRS